jgi:hypothetical protein
MITERREECGDDEHSLGYSQACGDTLRDIRILKRKVVEQVETPPRATEEVGNLATDNLALTQEFCRLAPKEWGAWMVSSVLSQVAASTRTWNWQSDDTFPGNGDFSAWLKSELVKMGWQVETTLYEDGLASASIDRVTEDMTLDHRQSFLYKSECAALVDCMNQVLRLAADSVRTDLADTEPPNLENRPRAEMISRVRKQLNPLPQTQGSEE